MSSPMALDSARDKLHQLRVAKKIGFTVPPTVITNSLDSIRELRSKHPKIIYKAFDGGSLYLGSEQCVYTTLLGDEHFEEDQRESLFVCPGIFQAYQEKEYELRVTVVRDKVFAVRIDSQSDATTTIDWRQGEFLSVAHTLIDLDKECHEKCVQLLQELSLQFGAIDLIRTTGGEYVFLEINANGQWAWLQGLTDAPISECIAQTLASQK
jgi:glutathione synthase/RimK-type ligase-like ATP-grasp enzyme